MVGISWYSLLDHSFNHSRLERENTYINTNYRRQTELEVASSSPMRAELAEFHRQDAQLGNSTTMVVRARGSGLRSKAASTVCVWVAGHHHVFRAKPQVVDGLWTNHDQSLWFSWFPQGQPISSAHRDTLSSPAPAQRGGSPPLMPGVEREVATIHVTLDLLIDRWFDDFTYWKWWYSIAATAMECDPIHVVTQDGIQPLDWCGQRQGLPIEGSNAKKNTGNHVF